ncbi:hypothetical protein PybrP1_007620 [[Pythium] brassicae (nom. inval.)]|nr:hypothetical protein PybrP1_007620 [[Pythium] brassicae (nom. inval.)]
MRMPTHVSAPLCATYGRPGFLFERQRSAMRQNAFARARGVGSAATKRKSGADADSDDSTSSGGEQPESLDRQPQHHQHKRRRVLEGFKRMRVSSPPSEAPSASASSSYPAAAYATAATAANAMADSAMEGDDGDTRALVRVRSKWDAAHRSMPTKWTPVLGARTFVNDLQMPLTDPSCTAIVLFTAPPSAIPRSLDPTPRVQLVESDDDDDDAGAGSASSDDEQPFVRFEEIHDDDDDDNGEAMEID